MKLRNRQLKRIAEIFRTAASIIEKGEELYSCIALWEAGERFTHYGFDDEKLDWIYGAVISVNGSKHYFWIPSSQFENGVRGSGARMRRIVALSLVATLAETGDLNSILERFKY